MRKAITIMKVLITGAAGFIGSHTAERCFEKGFEVIGIDNFSPYYDVSLKRLNAKHLAEKGISILEKDLRTDNLSTLLPKEIDFIIHFSGHPGISSTSSFEDYLTNNFIATQRLLDWVQLQDRKPYFVNICTSSAYGLDATLSEDQAPLPASWYGVTKLAAEQLVLAYTRRKELQGTSLRLFSVFGPRERPDKLYTRLIDCGLNNKAFPLYEGSLSHVRSFTYVQDIVDGIMSVLQNTEACNGEVINLGTSEENTTAEGIDAVEKVLGLTINKEVIPARSGDQSRTSANIDKARRLLNYNPQTTLLEGVKAQVAWFKENFT